MTAYRFWYPTVSVEGIFNGNRSIGIKDNEGICIAAAGPRQVGFTLNSDKHLVLPPGYKEEVPGGYYVGQSAAFDGCWKLDGIEEVK
jgi:hypothetical protein